MGIFSSLKIHSWRWEMKTRLCNLKGEDLKESQGLLWPEYKLEKALLPPGGSLSRGLSRLENGTGWISALRPSTGCPCAGYGLYKLEGSPGWICRLILYKPVRTLVKIMRNTPCHAVWVPETPWQPVFLTPLSVLNPLKLVVPLPSTYTSLRDFQKLPTHPHSRLPHYKNMNIVPPNENHPQTMSKRYFE